VAVVASSAAGADLSFLGLRHLAGNVREWTIDTWRERRWEALAPRSVQHASRVELPAPEGDLPAAVTVRSTYAGDPNTTHYEAAWRAGLAPGERSEEIGVRFVVLRR
jgi:formylglycine-generating enzyme required for sulfatase activity